MSHTFALPDHRSLADLQVFLGRAGRVEEGSTRIIATGGVLAVYTAIFYPQGLLDESPTVLGLRTFPVDEQLAFDAVVPVRSLLERLERAKNHASEDEPVSVTLPLEVPTVTWAAISPPRGGWVAAGSLDPQDLERTARAGIDAVAAAVDGERGEQIVTRVRSEVWSKPIEGAEYLPAGAAFAAFSLGFLHAGDQVAVFGAGAWTRLTSRRGHVLVKQRAWTLAR